jgi:type IV pilus assembly protein PilW
MRNQKMSSAGFSLVEILVGMVMGLLGIIIIFQVFEVSEGIKRTSTSGGDAMQYGSLALYTLERDLRQAGSGINNLQMAGCNTLSYDEQLTPSIRPAITMVPVIIGLNLDPKLPDSLTITYGNSQTQSTPVKMTNTMATGTSFIKVDNRYGFLPGNRILISEAGKPCWIAQITALPDTAPESDQIWHDTGTFQDANNNTVTARYNGPTGFTDSASVVTLYTENARIYNLSSTPTRDIFSVANSQLMLDSNRMTAGPGAIADNIVQLKAQYGHDNGVNDGSVANTTYAPDDGMVDNYTNTMPSPTAALDWTEVIAVRLAIVARSAQAEKPKVSGGPCDATTVAPTWAGGTLDLTADPNWKCYRYRVFESIVPLRNAIWQAKGAL